jgi:hypothetical protein
VRETEEILYDSQLQVEALVGSSTGSAHTGFYDRPSPQTPACWGPRYGSVQRCDSTVERTYHSALWRQCTYGTGSVHGVHSALQ